MEGNSKQEAGLLAAHERNGPTIPAVNRTNPGRTAHSTGQAGRSEAAADEHPSSPTPIPSVNDRRRQDQVHSAFSANTEVQASTPRGTIWRGGHPLDQGQIAPREASPDLEGSDEGQPSLALGTVNVHKLGPKEAARQHMLQWERIYEYHRDQNPSALPVVEKNRKEAKRVYESLRESERAEDVLPQNQIPAYQNERIQARTALLWKTIVESPDEGCGPMKTNITAALKGYDTGLISFSVTYTLIYAGRIVDTSCKTYAEFTHDREERLDRYFAEHDPGYLWWEPPLARAGGGRVLAKKSTTMRLDRGEDEVLIEAYGIEGLRFVDEAAHYKVPLGFKRDDRLRRRLDVQPMRRASVVAKETMVESPALGKRKRHEPGSEDEEERARVTKRAQMPSSAAQIANTTAPTTQQTSPKTGSPTIFFDMLLDSGAELPLLLHDDFSLLGFTHHDTNAASVIEIAAAAGQSSSALCFDLLVGLEFDRSLHGTDLSPDYSEARFFPSRVVKLPSSVTAPPHGGFSGERLSGMLPFLAYYIASAPGNGQLRLGEERFEVLGLRNMPAGLKYDPFRGVDAGVYNRMKERMGQVRVALDGRGKTNPGLMLQSATMESKSKTGRTLVDRDVLCRDEGEIESSIEVLDHDGSVIDQWKVC